MTRQGNHWARVCVANINALASGHFKPNVYVESDGFGKFPEFTMLLPGILLQFRKRSNSDYVIFNMQVAGNYTGQQKALEKPGLYKVRNNRGELLTEFVANGHVQDKDRVVAISDQFEFPRDSADACSDAIKASPMSQFAGRNGFDMHFTPGVAKIGGLKRLDQALNAANCPELRESALLLAKTMTDARKIQGVNWVSQGGGSGVLTQAMRLLKEQNVRFDPEIDKHHVFFSELTINLVVAEKLARDIGLKFERQTKSINYLSPSSVFGSGLGGAWKAAYYRYRSDPENYTLINMGTDMTKEVYSAKGAIGVVTTLGLSAGLLLGVSATTVTTAAGLTAASALGKTGAPRFYKKIAGKL